MTAVAVALPTLAAFVPVTAQETGADNLSTTASPDSGQVERAFDRYVVQGGWVTLFGLIPLSIAALALTIQYAAQTRRTAIVPREQIDEFESLFASRRYADAVARAAENRSILAFILHRGLTASRHGVAAMDQAMEDALEECATTLHRRIEPLNLIGSVSPMIGLFGTVHGIIGMFGSISDAGGVPIMARISANLGTALVATFWGLLIAIPALAAFGILRGRIDILMGECAVAAETLTARFREPMPDAAPRPASGGAAAAPSAVAVVSAPGRSPA
ncbi:MAG: MotA/TolQ/ExbB proton channel family protein [Phycisphaerales bacterium]|nr:MotA/TolQ/ExbB proton channel family protein [Phycisphaerales bacterium]